MTKADTQLTKFTQRSEDTPEEAYWHLSPSVLMEFLAGPIEEHIADIQIRTPVRERETRLHLMQPVRGALPPAMVKAWEAYIEAGKRQTVAWKAYIEEYQGQTKCWNTYIQAKRAAESKIAALHAIECPGCPWDGNTIFPY